MARPPRIPQSRKPVVRAPLLFRKPAHFELPQKAIPHGHLMAITAGRGDEEAFLTVCFRVLLGGSLTVCADEEGEKALEKEFDPAVTALITLGERIEKTGKVIATGDELTALRAALVLTDELQEIALRRQYNAMHKQVQGFVGGFAFTMKNLRRLKAMMDKDSALAVAVEQ